jgi:hypothetical protein
MPYEQLQPELWNVKPEGNENLLISIAGPVVVFRIKVMDLPGGPKEKLYETLLKLNTTDMVHGAFGIEGNAGGHHPRPARSRTSTTTSSRRSSTTSRWPSASTIPSCRSSGWLPKLALASKR